jgi:hypothetical protein
MQASTYYADSSVSTVIGYRLYIQASFLEEAGDFSLPHSIQTGSGVHPFSHPMGTRGSFPWGGGRLKQVGHETDHSPPSSVEVKKDGAIPPLHVFMT